MSAGRKPAIVVGSTIFGGGAVLMSMAHNYQVLLLGRFIIGLGVGLASMAVPLYIAEAAPPEARGALVTLNNVFITFGQFVACVVDGVFSKVDYPHGWRWMLGLGAIPAAIQFLGFLYLPESPRWLARYKGKEAAGDCLKRIRGTGNVLP